MSLFQTPRKYDQKYNGDASGNYEQKKWYPAAKETYISNLRSPYISPGDLFSRHYWNHFRNKIKTDAKNDTYTLSLKT